MNLRYFYFFATILVAAALVSGTGDTASGTAIAAALTHPSPAPSPAPSPTPPPNTGPSKACVDLTDDFTNLENQIIQVADSTRRTMDAADHMHYIAIPFVGMLRAVDRNYNETHDRIYSSTGAFKAVFKIDDKIHNLNPQPSGAQLEKTQLVLTTTQTSLNQLSFLAQQALRVRHAIPVTLIGSALQLYVAGLGTKNTNSGWTTVLGSGIVQNFITLRSQEGDNALPWLVTDSVSPESAVASVHGAVSAWNAACSPQSPGTIQIFPTSLTFDDSHKTQTVVVSETGYSSAFTGRISDDSVAEITSVSVAANTVPSTRKPISKTKATGGKPAATPSPTSSPTVESPNAFNVSWTATDYNHSVKLIIYDTAGNVAEIPVVGAQPSPTPAPTPTIPPSPSPAPSATSKP